MTGQQYHMVLRWTNRREEVVPRAVMQHPVWPQGTQLCTHVTLTVVVDLESLVTTVIPRDVTNGHVWFKRLCLEL